MQPAIGQTCHQGFVESLQQGFIPNPEKLESIHVQVDMGRTEELPPIEDTGIIIEQLRPRLEDKMPDGITWEDVEVPLREMGLERLREGLSDPATLWAGLVEGLGPLAIKPCLGKGKARHSYANARKYAVA